MKNYFPLAFFVAVLIGGVATAQFPNFQKLFHPPAATPAPAAPAPAPGGLLGLLHGTITAAQGAGIGVNKKAEEWKIGCGVAVDIVSHFGGLDEDEAANRRVVLVGRSVARKCGYDVTFRFGILNSSHVDGMSAPGGWVFITRGLYDQCPDNAELAAVLGHEITHIAKRHVLSEYHGQQLKNGLLEVGASVTGREQLANLFGACSKTLFHGLSYTDEYEADQGGRSLASEAGYSRGALVEFLEKMQAHYGNSQGQVSAGAPFPTHPPFAKRIERLHAG